MKKMVVGMCVFSLCALHAAQEQIHWWESWKQRALAIDAAVTERWFSMRNNPWVRKSGLAYIVDLYAEGGFDSTRTLNAAINAIWKTIPHSVVEQKQHNLNVPPIGANTAVRADYQLHSDKTKTQAPVYITHA